VDGGGPAGSAIGAVACDVGAAREPLADGRAAVPAVQAARTAHIMAASAGAHRRLRRIGKDTG
jgi:hypothetical protein